MKLATDTVPQTCDGCGGTIEPSRPFIIWKNDITCKACVEHAALKLNPQTPDAWGRLPNQLL